MKFTCFKKNEYIHMFYDNFSILNLDNIFMDYMINIFFNFKLHAWRKRGCVGK